MRERRGPLVALVGILMLAGFFGVAYTRVTATEAPAVPKRDSRAGTECSGCHEMQPEIVTWQVSSHSKVPCIECHEVDQEAYRAGHENQGFKRPIRISDSMPSSVCMKCHTENRMVTASGDLVIPHDRHAKAGVTCVKCHSGVVHAKIADRGLTAEGPLSNYKAWTVETARQVMTKFYTQPSMWTCIECHKQAGITRQCSACHTRIANLPSHDSPDWISLHGKNARTDIGKCTTCHITPDLPKFASPSTGDLAADFARAQQFCYNCHLKRPETHQNTMVPIHPGLAAAKGIQNCFTCHERNRPESGTGVTGTYCNKCHWLSVTK